MDLRLQNFSRVGLPARYIWINIAKYIMVVLVATGTVPTVLTNSDGTVFFLH